jgi:predicted TIM-barrel fold metal-dependent hydrolase
MIIDMHAHINTGERYLKKTSSGAVDKLISEMDKTGVDVCAVNQLTDNMILDNDAVLKAARDHPNRLVPFAHINPGMYCNEGKKASAEIDRTLGKLKLKGVKLHPEFDHFQMFDEVMNELMEKIQGYGVPILFHSGGSFSTPLQIVYVAKSFPKIPVLLGHMGTDSFVHEAVPAAKLSENIYLETSIGAQLLFIENAVHELGAERIVWGTDFPYGSPAVELKKIQTLDISKKQKKMILGENAAKILGLKTRSV